MKSKVVCFDIDGTLYPKWVTDLKLVRSFFPSPLLALRYQRFRKEVRKNQEVKVSPENQYGFRLHQAKWLSRGRSEKDIERTMQRLELQFYDSWRSSFAYLKPFPYIREAMADLRSRGIRIAALSDFPIHHKLQALGVEDLVEFSACTEESGYLKPHPAPFGYICTAMGVEPQEVVYVGDSCRKDMEGASRVGMRTCLIAPKAKNPSTRAKLELECKDADMICADYQEFIKRIGDLLN